MNLRIDENSRSYGTSEVPSVAQISPAGNKVARDVFFPQQEMDERQQNNIKEYQQKMKDRFLDYFSEIQKKKSKG